MTTTMKKGMANLDNWLQTIVSPTSITIPLIEPEVDPEDQTVNLPETNQPSQAILKLSDVSI